MPLMNACKCINVLVILLSKFTLTVNYLLDQLVGLPGWWSRLICSISLGSEICRKYVRVYFKSSAQLVLGDML